MGPAKTGHCWPCDPSEVQESMAETCHTGHPLPSYVFRIKASWAKSQLGLLLGETVLLWIDGFLLCNTLHKQQGEAAAAGCPISLVRQRDSLDPTLAGDLRQARTRTNSSLAVLENCTDPPCEAELLLLPTSCVRAWGKRGAVVEEAPAGQVLPVAVEAGQAYGQSSSISGD